MMQTLSLEEYQKLTSGAEPLASEIVNGEVSHKVLKLSDNSIMKLFRLKRLLSSARLSPYCERFHRNAARLWRLGIPTVHVLGVYRIPTIKRTAVHYRFLSGVTLREHCQTFGLDRMIAEKLGHFFSFLHQNGIFFRSIHFNNVIITTDQGMGLIDVVDMRFKKSSLGLRMRIRNLKHLFRYDTDIQHLSPLRDVFFEAYCEGASLRDRNRMKLKRHFESYFGTLNI